MTLSFKKISTLALLLSSGSVMAGTMGPAHIPDAKTNYFVGLGGSYNSIQTKQNVYAIGVASYTGPISGSGTAQGPAYPFYNTENTFAPEVQAGFFRHIMDTNYLWGVKFSYQYLGAVATHSTFTVSQSGTVNGTVLNGNVLIQSAQNKTTHELLLLPFIGQSFTNSQVYLGVGPALFGTRSLINGEIGFADISGNPSDLTGAPVDTSKKSWECGGAAQVGLSYFLTSDWTVDLSYTYAISNQYSANYAVPFTHYLASNGITTTGTGYTNTKQNVAAQAVTFTVNKVFSI